MDGRLPIPVIPQPLDWGRVRPLHERMAVMVVIDPGDRRCLDSLSVHGVRVAGIGGKPQSGQSIRAEWMLSTAVSVGTNSLYREQVWS